MTTAEIFVALGIWALLTIGVFVAVKRRPCESRSFGAGVAFLILTIIGMLTIHFSYAKALQCQATYCWPDKVLVDTLLQFVLITWGALGGSLLAKTIESKE